MPVPEQQPRGLGGWLILLGIGLVTLPGNLLMQADQMGRHFSAPEVRAHIDSDPQWHLFAFLETGGSSIAAFLAVVLIVLFFFKHRTFPTAFAVFAGLLVLLTIARTFLVMTLPGIADEYRRADLVPSAVAFLIIAAWVTYLFRSRRAQLTFTRRFYMHPVFPFFTTA